MASGIASVAQQPPTQRIAAAVAIAIAPKASSADDAPPAPFTPSSTNGVTQRNWVIPPRPKPGRKPATDTPPSKRKAQNRAAQRAFRERRAARLTELEDQIKHIDESKECVLMDQVSKITVENNVLRATVAELRRDIEALQKRDLERGPSSSNHTRHSSFSSVSTAPSFSTTFVTQMASPTPSPRPEAIPCFEEAFGRKCCGGSACRNSIDTVSTISTLPLSRQGPQTLEMEIDFTNMFGNTSNSRRNNNGSNSRDEGASRNATNNIVPTASPGAASPSPLDDLSPRPEESCGFCSEGTACVCAEMKVMQRETEILRQQNLAREAIAQSTINIADKKATAPSKGGCTGEPGSCAQCQTDPMSTLFCRTLATKKTKTDSNKTGKQADKPDFVCCGGTACGKNRDAQPTQPPESADKTENTDRTYIPCSDAYLSLSRHKRFMDADLGTVVRKLNTSGLGVEVSSVKQVLEYLEALESFQNNTSQSNVDGPVPES